MKQFFFNDQLAVVLEPLQRLVLIRRTCQLIQRWVYYSTQIKKSIAHLGMMSLSLSLSCSTDLPLSGAHCATFDTTRVKDTEQCSNQTVCHLNIMSLSLSHRFAVFRLTI